MTERFSMYDPALRGAVLRLLEKWKRLPEGDLFQLLAPEDRLRFRDDVIEDLVWQGLLLSEQRGDERVLTISEAGERWVQESGLGRRSTQSEGEARG